MHLPSLGRRVDRRDHAFEGPVAMQANGGEPVPFQWTGHVYDEERELTQGAPAASGSRAPTWTTAISGSARP